MSTANQLEINRHKEVWSEPVIALHLSVQKKELENRENAVEPVEGHGTLPPAALATWAESEI